MQVTFHIGAHCTDEDRLLNSLLNNQTLLNFQGVIVPKPREYRKLILRTIKYLNGEQLARHEQKKLLRDISDERKINRLILSGEDFLSYAARVFSEKSLYGNAAQHISALSELFSKAEVEFHLCIRNPATFIPAVFTRTNDMLFAEFINETDVYDIRWSDVIHTICKAHPKSGMTVWCYEDAPLIWTQLIYEVSQVDTSLPNHDTTDLLTDIMTKEGVQRCQIYLNDHPPQNELQRRRIIKVFLSKFAIPITPDTTRNIPGWTQGKIDRLTDLYEQDLYEIERIPGVKFITP